MTCNTEALLTEYAALLENEVAAFVAASKKIGGEVAEQAEEVQQAFTCQREFLAKTPTTSSAPDQAGLQALLAPTSQHITKTQTLRDAARGKPLFNNLSAIADSIAALGWVCDNNKPSAYVKEMSESGQFYLNKVLMEHKSRPSTGHTDWANAWKATTTKLHQIVLKNCPKGIKWGGASTSPAKPVPPPKPSSAGKSAGGPPPPPPPPPADSGSKGGSSPAPGNVRAQLFADLNKGGSATAGLRKVADDEKTHKNPTLREQAQATAPPAAASNTSGGYQSGPRPFRASGAAKTPVFKLDDKRWRVEHQVGRHDIEVEAQDLKQAVYVFGCRDCTVVVRGKLSSVVLDTCEKVGVLCDSLLSTLEFTKCASVSGQVLGTVPTVNVDSTDGCQLYLSKESVGTDIIFAKTSAFNVHVPSESGEPGDFVELNVPEQFKTKIEVGGKGGAKLTTTPTDINN